MRIVSSAADLKKIVPATGGRALRKPRPKVAKPVAELVPEPVPEPVMPVAPVVNIDLDGLTASNAKLLETITEVLKGQKPAIPLEPAAKITEWQFDVQRDDKGFIKGMTAKAK